MTSRSRLMTDLTKPRRVIDEGFLVFVRSLRCLVFGCTSAVTDPHHLKSRGAGGSDHTAVPMCRRHHGEVHAWGPRTFGEKYSVNLWAESSRVLGAYIEVKRS